MAHGVYLAQWCQGVKSDRLLHCSVAFVTIDNVLI